MQKDLPLAALCGVVVGVGTYALLVTDWFVAGAVTAVYAGATYFYLAFDVSLLGRAVRFDETEDRVGYAVGLFGLSVSPLALANQYGGDGTSTLPLVVLFVGTIAFLLLASQAQRQGEHTS
ncbi:hypothetical protein AUR64_16645 [Haloprofundus marisrubri]|uniref:Uncharacterized protein n=1 Tax=Haloprofundus marisrubri TaxID=1514971 RepID=A0A0W1R7K2_9EURY|nr:hypothetical protein [Haloprofundus marisrubri]KTG09406.1 hypothetical protein AUR64_16645 [Haloprofundus marisrubri]